MNKLTLLEINQIFGDSALNIIKQRGKTAVITDFAILLGGEVSPHTIDNSLTINKRSSFYWTKTNSVDKSAYVVHPIGIEYVHNVCNREVGGRLVLPFTNDLPITINKDKSTSPHGILEIEYGYYPRRVAPLIVQRILEKNYISDQLKATGNIYTTDSREWEDNDKLFLEQSHIEYAYARKRYVRIKANTTKREFHLSNGQEYKRGDYVWVEVEPVKWLLDKKEKIMITEEIIFAGVQFNYQKNYRGDFDSTNIKRFIDTYLSKELFQIQNMEVNETNSQETPSTNEEEQFSSLIEKLYKKGYSAEQILFHTADILKKLSNNSENTIIHQKTKHL